MSDDLREQVFGTVAVWHSTLPLEHLQALVDAVLALPALRKAADEPRGELAAPSVGATARRLAWFTDEELSAELDRRRLLDGPDG